MGLLSAPTQLNGNTTNPIQFTLVVNGTAVPVTLATQSSNSSIDDLVSELQSAVDSALISNGTLGDGLQIGTDTSIDLSSTPITLGLTAPSNGQLASDADFILSDGTKEVIGSVSAASTASFTTRADLQTAIQNAINNALAAGGLSGTITVSIDDTTGAITLTGSSGLTILGGGKVVDASANFSLVNPEDGTDKLTADALVSALSHGKFFYDAAHQGTDINGNPTTGIISGAVSGGIGARLDIAPGGALAGLFDTLHADATLSATSPNWLLAPPSLNDPLGFGADPTALSTSAFTLANAAPNNGQLTQNISFIISDKTGHSAIGVLNASDTSTFSSPSQLVNALQGAVNDALTRLHAAEGGSPSTTTITVGISSGKITLTASGIDLSIQDNDNALGASVDIVKLITGKYSAGDPAGIDESTGNAFAFTLPDFDFTNFKVPSIFALLSDPASLVDGLDSVLQTLQQGLSGQLFGTPLPFLGSLLANDPAVNFLGDVRNDLPKPLANTLRNNNVNLGSLVTLIKNELFDVLGPSELNLLTDENHDGSITPDDIVQTGVDPNNPFDSTSYIQFGFDIGKSITFKAPVSSFNLGIPALNLQANFQPEVTINFDMHFGFGVDTKQGFYFVTNKPTDTTPEASVSVKADFGSTQTLPASVTGQLLFLALGIKDGIALDPSQPNVLTGVGEDILIGGTGNDAIDGGGDDLVIGGAARLQNRISGTIANPFYDITNSRFQVLTGT